MVKIIFGKSSSQNYNLAVKRAKNYSTKYSEESFDNNVLHYAEYDLKQLKKAVKLWEIVKAWKATELYINDEIASIEDLNVLEGTFSCMKRRDDSLLTDEYCNGDIIGIDSYKYFGCKRLKSFIRDVNWDKMGYYYYHNDINNIWYRQGKFDKEYEIFIVDKERIKKILKAEAIKSYITECDYFKEDEVIKMVEDLPDQIDKDNDAYVIDDKSFPPVVRSKEEVEKRKEEERKNTITIGTIDKEKVNLKPVLTNITYKDIGGLDREIRLIKESVEIPFKYPELFTHLGITAYKGILFYGPPGTGKTQLAKAVANESEMNFYTINGPEIFDKYLGESEKKLREIFETAKNNAPSVIFIDELDSIASKRDDSSFSVHYNKIVTQLLTLMDGMDDREKVIVMAATNRQNSIDPALRRPGRFDFEIYIAPPDEKGREEILNIHSRNMPLDVDINIPQIAESLYGYVGADIAALCKEAALFTLRRHLFNSRVEIIDIESMKVTLEDFKQAKNKIVPTAGREVLSFRPNVKWSDVVGFDDEKEIIEKKIIKPWIMKDKYSGFRKIKGVLLAGPSGVGKTYISKAIASKIGMNIISLKGSDVISKYMGESVSNIKHYFDKARELSPCMILIDEIDAIAPHRENNTQGAELVNELLSQMDGYDELTDVLVLATTNSIDIIDKAVLRSGRFDLIINIDEPTKKEIQQMVKFYLDKAPLTYDEDILSMEFDCKTGADVENIVNQAIYEAIWEEEVVLKRNHFNYIVAKGK